MRGGTGVDVLRPMTRTKVNCSTLIRVNRYLTESIIEVSRSVPYLEFILYQLSIKIITKVQKWSTDKWELQIKHTQPYTSCIARQSHLRCSHQLSFLSLKHSKILITMRQ